MLPLIVAVPRDGVPTAVSVMLSELASVSLVSTPLPRPPAVLAVGRLDPRKGHGLLVEALGLLARDGTDLRVVIVGDGPDEFVDVHVFADRLGHAQQGRVGYPVVQLSVS